VPSAPASRRNRRKAARMVRYMIEPRNTSSSRLTLGVRSECQSMFTIGCMALFSSARVVEMMTGEHCETGEPRHRPVHAASLGYRRSRIR
jgi:hypothetical protein